MYSYFRSVAPISPDKIESGAAAARLQPSAALGFHEPVAGDFIAALFVIHC